MKATDAGGNRPAGAAGEVSPRKIEEARAGSARAFEEIYRAYVARIYGLCLRMVADPQQAELLTQDAFVRAWEKLGSYDGRGSFGGWLHRLAVNVVIEDRRRAGRQARWLTGDEDLAEQVAGISRSIDDALDLEQAIAGLPPGARAAFVLHDVEGYRHEEIAAMTGRASGTIKAQLHRARTLLRRSLATMGKEAAR